MVALMISMEGIHSYHIFQEFSSVPIETKPNFDNIFVSLFGQYNDSSNNSNNYQNGATYTPMTMTHFVENLTKSSELHSFEKKRRSNNIKVFI